MFLVIVLVALLAGLAVGIYGWRYAQPIWSPGGVIVASLVTFVVVVFLVWFLVNRPWQPQPLYLVEGEPVYQAPSLPMEGKIVCPDGQTASSQVPCGGILAFRGPDGRLYNRPVTASQVGTATAQAAPPSAPSQTATPVATNWPAATQTPNVIVVTATPVATGTPVPAVTATSTTTVAPTRTPALIPNVVPSATATAVLGAQPPVLPVCVPGPNGGRPPVRPCWLQKDGGWELDP